MAPAKRAEKDIQNGRYSSATNEWDYAEGAVAAVTDGIDVYNILTKIHDNKERGKIINIL